MAWSILPKKVEEKVSEYLKRALDQRISAYDFRLGVKWALDNNIKKATRKSKADDLKDE